MLVTLYRVNGTRTVLTSFLSTQVRITKFNNSHPGVDKTAMSNPFIYLSTDLVFSMHSVFSKFVYL